MHVFHTINSVTSAVLIRFCHHRHAFANCNGDLGQSLHLAAKAIALSPGYNIFFLEIQAVALASTNDYLCACYHGHLHSIFSKFATSNTQRLFRFSLIEAGRIWMLKCPIF